MNIISRNYLSMMEVQPNKEDSGFHQMFTQMNKQEEKKLQKNILSDDMVSDKDIVDKIIENTIVSNTMNMIKQNEEEMKELLDD